MARPDPSGSTVNKDLNPSSKAIRFTGPVAIALFEGGTRVGFKSMVGRTRAGRLPAITVTVATAAISVTAAAVFDSDCCSVNAVGVGSTAVATASKVGAAATAVEAAVGEGLWVITGSFDDESEHPIIASAIRALSSGNVINRR